MGDLSASLVTSSHRIRQRRHSFELLRKVSHDILFDSSQAGKGYLLELIQTIYREIPSVVAQKNGGVGGFDESLSQAMLTGRPFIQLDNIRGKMNSAFLEAVLTCPQGGMVPARVPYKADIQVAPGQFIFQLTSNGYE